MDVVLLGSSNREFRLCSSQYVDCEGIVEEAVLLGAPVTASADEWKRLVRVVSGRIVNGFSRLFNSSLNAQIMISLQFIPFPVRLFGNFNTQQNSSASPIWPYLLALPYHPSQSGNDSKS